MGGMSPLRTFGILVLLSLGAVSAAWANRTRVNAIVRGDVQGVSYRAHTQSKARELGVNGWVRNLRSGNVEFEGEGHPDKVRALVDWAHIGPPWARVIEVIVKNVRPTQDTAPFRILADGP
jgi:acylphosphatase